jgi:hypothetical protein
VKLSRHQRLILAALADAPLGWLPTESFHELLFGVPMARRLRTGPLTGAQRAGLSRTLSRLEGRGLVHRPKHRGAWHPTDAGREAVGRLRRAS